MSAQAPPTAPPSYHRILFLTSNLPYPPLQGGALRTYNLLAGLARRRHTVDLLSFLQADEALSDFPLGDLCQRIATVPAPPARSPARRLRATFLSSSPDMALRLPSPAFQTRLGEWLQERRYDVIQAQSIEMGPYLLAAQRLTPAALCVFDDFNAEYLLQWRTFLTDLRQPARWPGALYSLLQTVKLRRYEARLCRAAGLALAVSEADAQVLRRLSPTAHIALVPNGVDTSQYTTSAAGAGDLLDLPLGDYLVFTGKMDFRPNVDAVLWFAERVWPRLRAAFPRLHLLIVGQSPHPRLWPLRQEPRIVMTGRVEDVRPYIAEAAVVIVPLRIGGGTRLKVLEAMAMGKAIVSTSQGCEGYPLHDGVHLRIADSPAAFCGAVASLLRQPETRQRLGQTAREFAVSHYDWSAIVPRLEAAYQEVLSGGLHG